MGRCRIGRNFHKMVTVGRFWGLSEHELERYHVCEKGQPIRE